MARATFRRARTLWRTLQMDVGYFRWHDEMTHEEAPKATAEEVVNALESTWVRFFGRPSALRLDPEGALRSRLLEEWCAKGDVELPRRRRCGKA